MTKPDEQAIFHAARQIEIPDARRAYLDSACGDQPALRGRVEALLRVLDEEQSFLSTRSEGFPGRTTLFDGETPGTAIGSYKLLEQIGEGGFGVVFMAEQTQPVCRKVALKVLKPGMDTRQVVARFEAERQALALMDHPNIAGVLDAGETASGRPYFVMELVRGVCLTDFCDQNHLSVRRRLELFVSLCRAVQHAHTKGVIHRDLKPSNVLVTLHDGLAVVKVIDFGIAKALGQKLTDKTLFTGFAQMIGTPLYMSPEQAEMSGLDVDTRADIYALGVILYELLTGNTPFEKERLREAGFDELRRIIREEEPPRPSARISTLADAVTVSANRECDPKRLSRLVRGELDWIVMKCLEKDRTRRYETANGLARDVQRYLNEEAVEACPPSAGYRVRKFIRRNKGRVAAAAALALSLLAGVSAVMVVQAKANRDQAAAQTNRAAREAWTDASVAAALREARERTQEAWALADYPDRMGAATHAAAAAVRRADDFIAGGLPSETTLAELASTREVVDDLSRHTRLITTFAANQQQFADNLTGRNAFQAHTVVYNRYREALRQFGLDPINNPVHVAARTVATSRVRDALLGILLEWHLHATYRVYWRLTGADPVVRDRLAQVVRSARQLSGGAYARWQNLLDRNDVPGLVAFAASTDGLSFRSYLVNALGKDLQFSRQYPACRAFLRAAIGRYPHDVWLHSDLAVVCADLMQPPDHHEALRHLAAASAQRPDSPLFHLRIGACYTGLGAYDLAVAAYRRSILLCPHSDIAYEWMGEALLKKKDPNGAALAFRKALHLWPKHLPSRMLLGRALTAAGRHAEAAHLALATLRQDPAWAADPRNHHRYNAACLAMNRANGMGANAPQPSAQLAYRKQALDLLTAELAAIRQLAAGRDFVYRTMQDWLADEDLAAVRLPMASGQFSPDERDAWQKLWADVRDLHGRTAPQTGSPHSVK